MGNRKTPLETGEYYHVFNRGVDKRQIFMDGSDTARFFRCMQVFNSISPIGSLLEFNTANSDLKEEGERLVAIVAFCLNPNHYHFILRQEVDGGISEFMKRLSGGYTMYFNEKYKRSGSLFQGRFKSKHIGTDEYLKHLSAYVNLNYQVHKFGGSTSKLTKSSWKEYSEGGIGICDKSIILDQFSNNKSSYKEFALEALEQIKENKEDVRSIEFGG